jgi:uncharacterized membrane protein YphA (DoxX/SURF4 family)
MWASKPIASVAWAGFLLRVSLGLHFILAGIWSIEDFQRFSSQVYERTGFMGQLAQCYTALAPIVLIAAGGLLLVGLWTVAAALAAVLFFLPLFYGAGLFEFHDNLLARRTLYKDACILFACAALAFTGGGILSVDRLMKADR